MRTTLFPSYEEFISEDYINEAVTYVYWDKKGKYQKEYNKLVKKYVPDSGESSNEYGEVLRCILALAGDDYRNGLGVNDYRPEMKYIMKYEKELQEYLKSADKDVVTTFGKKYIDTVTKHQDDNKYRKVAGGTTALNKLTDAIVQLMIAKKL